MTSLSDSKNDAACADDDPRRERILNATFGLLFQHGYAGISTEAIARRAKVSKRELYTLFGSKQAILAAGIAAHSARMRLPLDLPPPRDVAMLATTLIAFGKTVLELITQPMVVALYRLAVAESTRAPELAQTLDANGREPTRAALTKLMAQAQAAGILGEGSPATLAGEFSGLLSEDLLMRVVLGVYEAPSAAVIGKRAQAATDAFLTLRGAARAAIGATKG